jgi:putative tricarboxylic transport membrane protein
MSDRIFGVILVALAASVALLAQNLEVPLSYEPVGPKAWPIVLAVLLAASGVMLTLRADTDAAAVFPRGELLNRVLAMIAVIGAYAVAFEPLGFALSTWLVTIALGRIFGGSWIKVVVAGALLGVGLYYGFDRLLDVTLPEGPLGLGGF